MVTLKDVAARAGVAVSTASRALNSSGYVDPETRDRVFLAAQELSYRPNTLARGLRGRRTGVIGFVVPDLRNQFYAEASSVLQDTIHQAGSQLLVGVSHDDPESELGCLERFEEQRVDGVIVIPTLLDSRRREKFSFPMVELNRVSAGSQNDSIVADESVGVEALTNLMLESGHRRIAFVVGPLETSTAQSRTSGFTSAMSAADLESEDCIFHGAYSSRWGSDAAERILGGDFTAAIVASSQVMEGFVRVCRERDVRIPDQISLGGMGDPAWFGLWNPGITTYAPDLATMGRLAAERMLARLSSGDASNEPVHAVVPGKVIERESIAFIA